MEDKDILEQPVVETTESTDKAEDASAKQHRASVKELKALVEQLNKENVELREKLAKQAEYNEKIYAQASDTENKLMVVRGQLAQMRNSVTILTSALDMLSNTITATDKYLNGGKNNGKF